MKVPLGLWLLAFLLAAAGTGLAEDGAQVIDDTERVGAWRPITADPAPVVSLLEEGQRGAGLRFVFHDGQAPHFAGRQVKGDESWDASQGLSFWFRGDGSDGWVACSLVDESYTRRYATLVQLKNESWHKVSLRWDDFVPEIVTTDWFGENAMRPSQVRGLWFGRWFYFRPFGAFRFDLDELALEPKLPEPASRVPESAGIPRVLAKLRAKQPVTIVCLGDSITAGTGLKDPEREAYPSLLERHLRETFGYGEIAVVNRGVGGLETRQGIVLLPRDLDLPAVDLVTAHFGYNDYSSMLEKRVPAEACRKLAAQNVRELVRRVRRITQGKAEVLLIATIPGADEARRRSMDFFGEAAREAARDLRAGFSDEPCAVFRKAHDEGEIAALFVNGDDGKLDVAHLNEKGHARFAQALLAAFKDAE